MSFQPKPKKMVFTTYELLNLETKEGSFFGVTVKSPMKLFMIIFEWSYFLLDQPFISQ